MPIVKYSYIESILTMFVIKVIIKQNKMNQRSYINFVLFKYDQNITQNFKEIFTIFFYLGHFLNSFYHNKIESRPYKILHWAVITFFIVRDLYLECCTVNARTSSCTFLKWLQSLNTEEWLNIIGALAIARISNIVFFATCARSTIIPRRFISWITF